MWPQNGGSCELFVSWASPPSVWKQETGSTSMLWDAGGQNFLSPDRGEYTAFNQRRKKRRERSVCSGFPTSLTASRQEAGGREGLLSSALSPLMWKQIWNSSASSTRELHSSSPLNNYFVDLNPWFCRKPHACVCAQLCPLGSSVILQHLFRFSSCLPYFHHSTQKGSKRGTRMCLFMWRSARHMTHRQHLHPKSNPCPDQSVGLNPLGEGKGSWPRRPYVSCLKTAIRKDELFTSTSFVFTLSLT